MGCWGNTSKVEIEKRKNKMNSITMAVVLLQKKKLGFSDNSSCLVKFSSIKNNKIIFRFNFLILNKT